MQNAGRVYKYKDLWDELTDRMGWVDQENPYITFENDYTESIWWALSELYKKGLLYKGYKIQWYSPGNGTVLSSNEVSLGYKNTKTLVFVMFRKPDEEKTYYLAWTTTPWTTISNMALTINPKLDYVKLAHDHNNYIVAKDCVERVFGEEVTIIEEFKGKELLGNKYLPIFDYALQEYDIEQAWKIIPASYVTIDDGTGIVHTAPAYGADDFEACAKAQIPMFNPIDRDGCFIDQVPEFKGQWFKEADKGIVVIKERVYVSS